MYTRIYCLNDIDTNEFNNHANYIHYFGDDGKIANISTDISKNNEEFCTSINRLSESELAECEDGVYIHPQAKFLLAETTINNIKSYLRDLTIADFRAFGRKRLYEITHPAESFICYRNILGEAIITPLYEFIFNGIYSNFTRLIVTKVFHVKY